MPCKIIMGRSKKYFSLFPPPFLHGINEFTNGYFWFSLMLVKYMYEAYLENTVHLPKRKAMWDKSCGWSTSSTIWESRSWRHTTEIKKKMCEAYIGLANLCSCNVCLHAWRKKSASSIEYCRKFTFSLKVWSIHYGILQFVSFSLTLPA